MIYKNKQDSKLKVIVFIIALLSASIARFSVSIAGLEGPEHSKIWLGIAFISGIVGAVIYRRSFFLAGLISTSGFVAALVLRIVFDLLFVDPTSHNLFPIELVIWSMMAFIPAIAGAFLTSMIIRLILKSTTEKKGNKSKS